MPRDPRSTAPLAGPSRGTLIERKVRRRSSTWRLRARAVDRCARRDPDFIVVGSQKAGSTSLYAYLAGHPEVDQPLVEEINYFTLWPGRGHDWYRRHFPLHQAEGHITGETSPMAMVHPYALERVALELPDVKVVAIRRDPVARLLSHYRHSVKLGHEDLPLDQALRLEDQRVAADLLALDRDRFHSAYDLQKFSYVRRSLYFDQVEKIEPCFPGAACSCASRTWPTRVLSVRVRVPRHRFRPDRSVRGAQRQGQGGGGDDGPAGRGPGEPDPRGRWRELRPAWPLPVAT